LDYGTPLHDAAEVGRKDIVALLLEKGADREIRDLSGRTAAEVAEKAGYPELVPLLSVAKNNNV
jgi:ankyrin repeat protein